MPIEGHVNAKKETKAVIFDRSKYNRLIGEMIKLEFECNCEDLPIMDEMTCFEEIDLNLSEKKK